jgi:hypothetical protein
MSDAGDPQPDALALPIRARLFDDLLALDQPALTSELAGGGSSPLGREP